MALHVICKQIVTVEIVQIRLDDPLKVMINLGWKAAAALRIGAPQYLVLSTTDIKAKGKYFIPTGRIGQTKPQVCAIMSGSAR